MKEGEEGEAGRGRGVREADTGVEAVGVDGVLLKSGSTAAAAAAAADIDAAAA